MCAMCNFVFDDVSFALSPYISAVWISNCTKN